MAAYKDHPSSTSTKLLLVGDSGAGKTSCLATLANAGYKVRVMDFDSGLAPLGAHLTPEGVENLHYISFVDDPDSRATAWSRADKIFKLGWKTDTEDFGHISGWDSDTVLVLDSITFMADAIRHKVLADDGIKISGRTTTPQWGDTLRLLEARLGILTSASYKCNLVITALPIPITDDADVTRFYPKACTKNFSVNGISTYFNDVIAIKSRRNGQKYFRTVSDNRMELKNSASDKVPAEMDPDLAKLFELLQS